MGPRKCDVCEHRLTDVVVRFYLYNPIRGSAPILFLVPLLTLSTEGTRDRVDDLHSSRVAEGTAHGPLPRVGWEPCPRRDRNGPNHLNPRTGAFPPSTTEV